MYEPGLPVNPGSCKRPLSLKYSPSYSNVLFPLLSPMGTYSNPLLLDRGLLEIRWWPVGREGWGVGVLMAGV